MRVTQTTKAVLLKVEEERHRQHKKHGDNSNMQSNDTTRLAILAEEFGEVAKEVCDKLEDKDTCQNLYAELIQTAAVAVAFAETMILDGRVTP